MGSSGYAAFISYRHVRPDREWAIWLHRALESYRVPKALVATGAPERVRPVFRDEEELAASPDLSASIQDALKRSRYLVVVCSPRTPASRWIDEEVRTFQKLGRGGQVLALLIEGEPEDSFPPALRESPATGGVAIEPLAADVRPRPGESPRKAKEIARLRLLAALLGVRFDDLRQREQERQRQRWIRLSALLMALLALMSGLALAAVWQWQRAEGEARRALAQYLAAQAQIEMEATPAAEEIGTTGYERAALLALESLRLQPGIAGDRALRSAISRLRGHPNPIQIDQDEEVLAIAPGGDVALTVWRDELRLRSLADGAPPTAQPVGSGEVPDAYSSSPERALFAPDGRFVAIRAVDGVQIWTVQPFSRLASLPVSDGVREMRFLAGASRLLIAGESQLLTWDWTTDRPTVLGPTSGDASTSSLSGDGRRFAVSADSSVAIFALEAGSPEQVQTLHPTSEVWRVVLSQSGDRAAIGGYQSVEVWDVNEQRRLATLPHEWGVQAMRFSGDGQHLATVTSNVSLDAADPDATVLVGSTVRVWAIHTQEEITRVPLAAEGGVHGAHFSPDSDWLVTESRGNAAWIWNLWPENLRAEACSRLRRNLSIAESTYFLLGELRSETCPGLPVPDQEGGY